jgi:hypothetical protein
MSQEYTSRPPVLFENREDALYHALDLNEPSTILDAHEKAATSPAPRSTRPEFVALLGKPWVFNRRMLWRETAEGAQLCFCEGDGLPLTGTDAASRWFTDPANRLEHDSGGSMLFVRRSGRYCDSAVLPAFQFAIAQHPVLHVAVSEATADWQICVFVKGRSGPPLVASPWFNGPASWEVDLAAALKARGYDLHFAELHLAIGLWADDAATEPHLCGRVALPSAPALVPCLPVIRTAAESQRDGVPMAAVVTNACGARVGFDMVRVIATTGSGTQYVLNESDGIWSGIIHHLPPGEHRVRMASTGTVEAEATLIIRVTDGRFFGYDAEANSITLADRPIGPISGSYQGLAYFRDVGTTDEAMVQGQEAYDAWNRDVPPGEHWHYWEALTEAELDERFACLAVNGWKLAHLSQHWGVWERLDAGGQLAPHGAEQAALYYRVAERHGLRVVQALTHYPYGTFRLHTTPWQRYLDTGYQDADWINPESAFSRMFRAYLRSFARLFRSETALAWMTTSGEGDIAAGSARCNDTMHAVAAEDSNHLFLSEPIHSLQMLPEEHVAQWQPNGWIIDRWRQVGVEPETSEPWQQPLFGSRLYWIGNDMEPELDIGIECKFMQTAPVFVAEGSWPCPELHRQFAELPRTWCGTQAYRTRVRDSLYLSLVHRIPVVMTWEEQHTEDEHRVFEAVRSQVDWSQPFASAPVAVLVDASCVRERRSLLRTIEAVLTAHAIPACYVTPGHDLPVGTCLVLDARAEAPPLPDWLRSGHLPDELLDAAPVRVSNGYRANCCQSADGRTLLAYLYNRTHHEEIDYTKIFAGHWHRLPKPAALQIEISGLPSEPLRMTLFDLDKKMVCCKESIFEDWSHQAGTVTSDFFVLVHP